MKTIKKILQGGALSLLLAVMIFTPTFAACASGPQKGEYDGLLIAAAATTTYPVACAGASVETSTGTFKVFGKTSADCAQAAAMIQSGCSESTLMGTVNTIINIIIFVVGLLAVVMIIMGGIRYTTSQGDAAKVKSAKDTIMYGIIGLVVALLAFAIVNFVLTSVFTTA